MSFKEKMSEYIIKFTRLKYIQVLQNSFVTTMPILLVGSIFLLIAQFPIKSVKEALAGYNLGSITSASLELFSIFLVIVIAYYTTEENERRHNFPINRLLVVIVALCSFFLATGSYWGTLSTGGTEIAGGFLATKYLGTKGMVAAMVIGITSSELFYFFYRKKLTIKMPDGVPPMVVASFTSIIPFFLTMTFWWFLLKLLKFDIFSIINVLFKPLISVSDSLYGVFTFVFLNRFLWTVGIHGSNVISGLTGGILTPMTNANLEQAQAVLESGSMSITDVPFEYIATATFYDNYVWIGVFPIVLTLLISKSPRLRKLGILALLPSLFNIGEPIIFGIPVVLNPILFIPYVFGYTFLGLMSYILVELEFLITPHLLVPWTTPAPIKTLLATSYSMRAMLYVIFEWIVLFFIFLPFVKRIEKNDLKEAHLEEEDIDKKVKENKAKIKK